MERLVGTQKQLRQDPAAISAEHQVEGLSGHEGILICSHFRYSRRLGGRVLIYNSSEIKALIRQSRKV